MGVSGEIKNIPPKHQADATLNQANPVSGTKYTVLDTILNVRILGINAEVTWTVQPSPLESHLTVDGIAYVASVSNPVSGTIYEVNFEPSTDFVLRVASTSRGMSSFLFESRSVKVEAETTGGTSDPLESKVIHAKY